MSDPNRSAPERVLHSFVRLVFGTLPALVGAIVGGLITLLVAKETIHDQSVVNAYSQFASEAARMVQSAREGSHTKDHLARLESAAGVLMLYGSDEAICWSLQIMSRVKEPGIKVDISDDFVQMLISMREEVRGYIDQGVKAKKCPWSLM